MPRPRRAAPEIQKQIPYKKIYDHGGLRCMPHLRTGKGLQIQADHPRRCPLNADIGFVLLTLYDNRISA